MISKIQIEDQNLKEYKSLYDELLKFYPGKDPVNQMKELRINKNAFLTKFNEYDDLQRKLAIETKERNFYDFYREIRAILGTPRDLHFRMEP